MKDSDKGFSYVLAIILTFKFKIISFDLCTPNDTKTIIGSRLKLTNQKAEKMRYEIFCRIRWNPV